MSYEKTVQPKTSMGKKCITTNSLPVRHTHFNRVHGLPAPVSRFVRFDNA